MAEVLVSVVSPVYNDEEFIREFVDAVIAQTLEDWELICVDDGSGDGSVRILEEYEKKDPRIHLIRAEHRDAGVARNIGLAQATGKYVCFLDSDDIPRPEMLRRMAETAEAKQADVVACNTSSYSMKTKKESPMPWAIRWHLLPKMQDGVFSRNDLPGKLFQVFIVSPWNKMYRREMLTENRIQAQSQPAANDVVLTLSALACAKRICPIEDDLYVQRRDNAGSITGSLNSEAKHLCGYTSALGLKEKLEELGVYQQLRATYQQLAVHNTIWYLEQQMDRPKVFQADYDFLREEGFEKLDIRKLLPEAERGCTAGERESYKRIVGMSAFEYIYARMVKAEDEAKQLNYEVKHMQASRLIKAAKAIQRGRRAMRIRPRIVWYGRTTMKERWTDSRDKRRKEKKICILAFENYHYNVVENMVRICNPLKNYVEVRANGSGIREIGAPLEEALRSAVHWKNSDVEIPGVLEGEAPYIWRQRQMKLTRDAADRGGFDMILVPSPEFHPEWYEGLLKDGRSYQVIAGVHNLNDALLSPDAPAQVRRFYERADGYAVIYRFLAERMQELGYNQKPILVFPQIYLPRKAAPRDPKRIRFVVSGSVDPGRKNYEQLLEAFELIQDLHPRMTLELAGKAHGEYADRIRGKFLAMAGKTGLEFISHSDFMPFEAFEKSMDEADFMIAPVVAETMVQGIREVYGQTKISGVQGDMIKFACPAVVVDTIRMSDDLISSVLFYSTAEEMAARIRECMTPGAREMYREKALENSRKFLPEKVQW